MDFVSNRNIKTILTTGKMKGKKKMFTEGPDWWYNAMVNEGVHFGNKWDTYATGYKEAAEILSTYFFEKKEHRDTLVYPILFLFRHYFELRLKEIIEHGSKLTGRHYSLTGSHDLVILWNQVKEILIDLWGEPSTTYLDEAEEILKEFRQYDSASMSFRYPIDKKGNTSLKDLRIINLRHFIETIEPLFTVLEGASDGIAAFEDNLSEG